MEHILQSNEHFTITKNGRSINLDEINPSPTPSGGGITMDAVRKELGIYYDIDYIDLGLPSGTLWAKCNLGARKETEYGYYYQWGDTKGYSSSQIGDEEGKKEFSDDYSDYKYWDDEDGFTKYNDEDGKQILDASDDAATSELGSSWKTPTMEQFEELINENYTTQTFVEKNNVQGLLITSKINGNSIFFPACGIVDNVGIDDINFVGQYLTSELSDESDVDIFIFVYNNDIWVTDERRFVGQSIRPVTNTSQKLHSTKLGTKEEIDILGHACSELANRDNILSSAINKVARGLAESSFTNITHEDLKTLRDAGKLCAGTLYRITDYVTTTSQEDTRSAGHAFDIIVLALDEKTLCEDAKAIPHVGDTYFTAEGAKLESWELKYCLDNDKTRFAWAQEVKESIFTDDDLWFEYIGTVNIDGNTYKKWYNENFVYDGEGGPITENICLVTLEGESSIGDSASAYDMANEEIFASGENYSVIQDYQETKIGRGVIYYMKDEWNNECPYDFKNIQFKRFVITEAPNGTGLEGSYSINGIPGIKVDTEIPYWSYTFCMIDKDDNNKPYDVTVFQNKFLNDEGGYSRTYGNSIKAYVDENDNILHIQDNVFITDTDICDISEESGSFWGFCSNTFGNYCNGNTFGNYCYSNKFGNNCYSNTFGNNCYSNTFGNYCYSNKFGNSASNPQGYFENIEIASGNKNINLYCSQTLSSSNVCRNIHISLGVNNSGTTKTITINDVNQNYQTIVKTSNDVEINA